jgi:hypothetical protein
MIEVKLLSFQCRRKHCGRNMEWAVKEKRCKRISTHKALKRESDEVHVLSLS